MKYLQYLLETYLNESYQLATKEWSAGHDKNDVDQTINMFKELVNKNKVSGAERDINHWRKAGFDQFKQFVTQTKTQVETADTKGNRKKAIKAASNEILTVKKSGNMHLFIPLSKEASCFYAGNKTPWCISTRDGDNYFYKYTLKAQCFIFFLIHNDEIYAMVMGQDGSIKECQDKQNENSFSIQAFESICGMNRGELLQFATQHKDDIVSNLKNSKTKEDAPKMNEFNAFIKDAVKCVVFSNEIYFKPLKIKEIEDARTIVLLTAEGKENNDGKIIDRYISLRLSQIGNNIEKFVCEHGPYGETRMSDILRQMSKHMDLNTKKTVTKLIIEAMERLILDHIREINYYEVRLRSTSNQDEEGKRYIESLRQAILNNTYYIFDVKPKEWLYDHLELFKVLIPTLKDDMARSLRENSEIAEYLP